MIRLIVEHFLAFMLGFLGTGITFFTLAIALNLFTKWWLLTEPAVHLIFVNVTYGPLYAARHAWSVIDVDWDKLKYAKSLSDYCREYMHQVYLQSRN